MTTTTAGFDFAQRHFGMAKLGDLRLSRRLVDLAACLRENPCGTLPQAMPDALALKGAYRMLGNPKVAYDRVVEPHITLTRKTCGEPGDYLLIEDTTTLSFSQREPIADMGILSEEGSQGLLLHTCLAAQIEGWSPTHSPELTLVGLFGQYCWSRADKEAWPEKTGWRKRGGESTRWAKAIHEIGSPPAGVRWTWVADREGDIFETIARCEEAGFDWVIRAGQPHKVATPEGWLFEAAKAGPVLGSHEVFLRARPGVSARTATVEVRARTLAMAPPRDLKAKYAAVTMQVVEVREVNAPPGVEALHWVLLTSHACDSYAAAKRVVEIYRHRWLIEDYHKVLKTGTRVEATQLSTAQRIENLVAIHAPIAADILKLRLLVETRPDEEVSEEVLTPQMLEVLEARYGRPEAPWTHVRAIVAVARMGGFQARKSDGLPGWLTIWRGWQKLAVLTEGYRLAILQQERHG